MQAWAPDGYFISNGPGDPAVMDYAIKTVKDAVDRTPLCSEFAWVISCLHCRVDFLRTKCITDIAA
jgi:hypothetical protein